MTLKKKLRNKHRLIERVIKTKSSSSKILVMQTKGRLSVKNNQEKDIRNSAWPARGCDSQTGSGGAVFVQWRSCSTFFPGEPIVTLLSQRALHFYPSAHLGLGISLPMYVTPILFLTPLEALAVYILACNLFFFFLLPLLNLLFETYRQVDHSFKFLSF